MTYLECAYRQGSDKSCPPESQSSNFEEIVRDRQRPWAYHGSAPVLGSNWWHKCRSRCWSWHPRQSSLISLNSSWISWARTAQAWTTTCLKQLQSARASPSIALREKVDSKASRSVIEISPRTYLISIIIKTWISSNRMVAIPYRVASAGP